VIGLPEIVAVLMLVALNAYALTGGADFGGGVWDLGASGERKEAQRAHIAHSLAPIWEANHVWLIVMVVMLFTGFPAGFSTIAIVLHIPLAAMLIGIVLRGSAFIFRSYGSTTAGARRRWGVIFAAGSIVTPLFLGMVVGALASGAVGEASLRNADPSASFVQVYVAPWVGAFPIVIGLFALALFAFLAAVYLAYNAPEAALAEDFRRRALAAAAVVFVLAVRSFFLSFGHAPRVASAMMHGWFAIPLQIGTGVAAVTAILALRRRRYGVARAAAGAQVSGILWGWALAQYPFIVPPGLSIRAAAAPARTLELLVIGLAAGAAVLIPSLRYLLRVFASSPT
jgi:cytochrome bd ubiquinol oxidase subunit II